MLFITVLLLVCLFIHVFANRHTESVSIKGYHMMFSYMLVWFGYEVSTQKVHALKAFCPTGGIIER
jgi:hypothetical protein